MKLKSSRLRPIAIAGAFAASLLVLTACSADGGNGGGSTAPAEDCVPQWEFDTVVEGKLTVAGIQQLPGLDLNVTTGEMRGLDSVLLVGFAEANCLVLDVQPMPGPAAMAALTEGKADIGGGGWYATPARGEVLGQTDPLWYDQRGVIAPQAYETIDDLKGLKIGIVGGSVFEGPLGQAIGVDNVVLYQSIDAVLQDLIDGRIDAAMAAGATATIQVAERGLDQMTVSIIQPDAQYEELTAPGLVNYPHTKSNTALGEALNEYIAQARADGIIADTLAEFGITGDVALNGPQQ